MMSHIQTAIIISLSLFLASTVIAQETDSNPIFVGPFDVVPTLDVEIQRDDNLFRETAGSERQSTLTTIRPNISAVNDDGVVRYTLDYQLENGQYSSINNSDYTDHNLSAGMDWRVTVRHLLEFKTEMVWGHDNRSPDSVSGVAATDLDEYEDRNFSLGYTLGTQESIGLLRIGYRYQDKEYSTNRATTNVLDNDAQNVNVSFSVGTGAGSRVVTELSHGETDFSNDAQQNREEDRYSLGLQWQITGLIDGEIRLGESKNKLVNQGSSSTSSTAEASIKWSPYTYSTVDFSLSKGAQNTSNDSGFYTDTETQNITWNHAWNDVFSTSVSYNKQDNDYVGTNRNDTSEVWNFGVSYSVRRWLDIGLSLARDKLDSSGTTATSDYSRNTTTLTFKGKI